MPLGPLTTSVAVKSPSDGGVKVSVMVQADPAGRLQLVPLIWKAPLPPIWFAVMFMPVPEAHSCRVVVWVVPGRTESLMP